MKKIYSSPSIKISSTDFNPILFETSVPSGGQGNDEHPVDSKERDADGKGFYQGYEEW